MGDDKADVEYGRAKWEMIREVRAMGHHWQNGGLELGGGGELDQKRRSLSFIF